jgi:signal transduction histidine kinase
VTSEQDQVSIPQQLDDSLVWRHGPAVVVVAPGGETLFATSNAEFSHALLGKPINTGIPQPMVWRTAQNNPFRGIAAQVATGIRDARPAIVAVATDITHHEQLMSSFRTTLWSFVVLAAVLTGVVGWLAVRRGLSPLLAMKRKAEGITARQLDTRLAVDAVPVKLADLAQTLNAILSRPEESFQRLSDFSPDLAHEFRTPISNLLSNAIRHAPVGGSVAVSINASEAKEVDIDVINTGKMIPAEHLPRLFDRFFRADPSGHQERTHSGPGLAIVKSIAEAHGGMGVLGFEGRYDMF